MKEEAVEQQGAPVLTEAASGDLSPLILMLFFFKGNNFFIPPKLAVYRTCSVKVNCRLRVCYLPPEDHFYPCT